MSQVNPRYGLADDAGGGLGLTCNSTGLALAGVGLLRKSETGFSPRAPDEIEALLKAAYGGRTEPVRLTQLALGTIASALNRGDLAKAAMTAVFLKLPDLDADSAVRLILADDALTKYAPDQPRDDRGRWTDGGETRAASSPSQARGSTDLPGPPPPTSRSTTTSRHTHEPVDQTPPTHESAASPTIRSDRTCPGFRPHPDLPSP